MLLDVFHVVHLSTYLDVIFNVDVLFILQYFPKITQDCFWILTRINYQEPCY